MVVNCLKPFNIFYCSVFLLSPNILRILLQDPPTTTPWSKESQWLRMQDSIKSTSSNTCNPLQFWSLLEIAEFHHLIYSIWVLGSWAISRTGLWISRLEASRVQGDWSSYPESWHLFDVDRHRQVNRYKWELHRWVKLPLCERVFIRAVIFQPFELSFSVCDWEVDRSFWWERMKIVPIKRLASKFRACWETLWSMWSD